MKLLLLFSLVAFALARPQDFFNKYVSNYDYDSYNYSVTTQDGYILQLYRIGRANSDLSRDINEEETPAVLLIHGFLSSGEDFIYGGPSQGLAFDLVDRGYDVYIGNTRGSIYGLNHTTLNPTTDAAFWRFSFHEIGVYDLPAIIDKVSSISGQSKIKYVGHTEGATAFYILASELPEYQQKIERMVALGPVVYLQHSIHPLLQNIIEHYDVQSWVIKNLGMNVFKPSSVLIEDLQEACEQVSQKIRQQQEFCQNIYFLFNGYNSINLNQTTVQKALPRVPSSGSVHQVLHFAQMKSNERFESYESSPEKEEAHEYELSDVSVPVAVFYTAKDVWAQPSDVEELINKLPNVYKKQQYSYTNNLDFIYGKNLRQFNQIIAGALKEELHQN